MEGDARGYSTLGPVTASGDRAYGNYGVMGSNVPSWTQKYYGQSLTPEQFLNNPTAQDAVFNGQFGNYVNKYGLEGASKAWFAGEGGMKNAGATDQLGTSVGGYGSQFTQKYNQYQNAPGMRNMSMGEDVPQDFGGGGSSIPTTASGWSQFVSNDPYGILTPGSPGEAGIANAVAQGEATRSIWSRMGLSGGKTGGPNILNSPNTTGGDTAGNAISSAGLPEGNDLSAPGSIFGGGGALDFGGGGALDFGGGGALDFSGGGLGGSAVDFGGGGDLSGASGFGADFAAAVPVFHAGGVIGEGGSHRSIPPIVFANAPRMHGGGLMPNEVPIIGQKGERVLNRADTAAYDRGVRGNGQGGGTFIHAPIHVHAADAESFRSSEGQIRGAQQLSIDRATRHL
jgi:hypothetical protein